MLSPIKRRRKTRIRYQLYTARKLKPEIILGHKQEMGVYGYA